MTISLDTVRTALSLPQFDTRAAQEDMAPKPRGRLKEFEGIPAREAGVLALLFPQTDGLNLVLTRRQDHLRGHAGQISLPGGSCDPQDADYTQTALRETHEEIGVDPDGVNVVGTLASFYVPPSNFNIHPTVGYLPHAPTFKPNVEEVAEIITFRVEMLVEATNKHLEWRDFQGTKIQIPYYTIKGHKVWGATAVILGELEHRLSLVLSG